LERGIRLVLPGFPGLLSRFVLVFSVVHELGYGWLRLRGYRDKIEPCLTGEIECLANGNDTDPFTIASDQPDLGNPNPVIDARLADVFTPFCSNVVVTTKKAPVDTYAKGACTHEQYEQPYNLVIHLDPDPVRTRIRRGRSLDPIALRDQGGSQ